MEKKLYVCSMHPEIVSDKPGKCPKCGGMELVLSSNMTEGLVKEHDHSMMMQGEGAARDFLSRFYIVTLFLIPLVLLTHTVSSFLGLPDFAAKKYIQFGFATGIFYFSLVFFEHAKHEIKARQYGMMTLVSLAVGAGYLFSAASTFVPALGNVEFYLEISSLIWVLLFGHYLEAKSSSAAGDALSEVAKLLPKQAHLITIGKNQKSTIKDVEISVLKEGDVVLVKPGEKIPADGVIVKGSANMNEALISGESKPIKKDKGDSVVAGSICIDGSLNVKLNRVGENSTIGQIKKLITEAQKTKPSAQKIADKASSILTFAALFAAIIAILAWSLVLGKPFAFSLTLAITALVIACPHALGLAIPTVSTIATTLAVKNGVFLKDLGKIEVVKNIDWIVFDKTGTLTQGKFGIADIFPAISNFQFPISKQISTLNNQNSKLTKEQRSILQIAASLESHSSHVIGQSIQTYAKENDLKTIEVNNFKNIAGKGIEGVVSDKKYVVGNKTLMQDKGVLDETAQAAFVRLSKKGQTVIFIADRARIIGLIGLADSIKPESYQTVKALHSLGIKVAMLTGDHEKVAQGVARELKIDTYFAQVLPENKYKHVKELQAKGQKVIMVGDGVNDAPALTQADVGVAVGAGTDVAVEAGDVVLTRNNPEDIVRLIKLSRAVYSKMVQNLLWATGYNVVAIPAAIGVFAPWGFFLKPQIGALLMALSSVIVVINALALKRVKLRVGERG